MTIKPEDFEFWTHLEKREFPGRSSGDIERDKIVSSSVKEGVDTSERGIDLNDSILYQSYFSSISQVTTEKELKKLFYYLEASGLKDGMSYAKLESFEETETTKIEREAGEGARQVTPA